MDKIFVLEDLFLEVNSTRVNYYELIHFSAANNSIGLYTETSNTTLNEPDAKSFYRSRHSILTLTRYAVV